MPCARHRLHRAPPREAGARGRAPVAHNVVLEELHCFDHALPGGLVLMEQVAAQEQDVRLRPQAATVARQRAREGT